LNKICDIDAPSTAGATLRWRAIWRYRELMRRVVVFGTTGSGKSWLAKRLAERHGLRLIELDALNWGPGWQPAPIELLRHRVEREIRDGDWIVVGNYDSVRDLTWRAADTLIWLDLPFSLVIWRLFWRTLRRSVSKENLWGTGNTESLVRSFFTRQSILLYAMKSHRGNRRRFTVGVGSFGKDKEVVRLQSPREVARLVTASAENRTGRAANGGPAGR
jgi:adenylate kinase family enzyme